MHLWCGTLLPPSRPSPSQPHSSADTPTLSLARPQGNTLRSSAVETAEAECDVACSGDSGAKCGGAYRMNLFVNRGLLAAAASASASSAAAATSSSAAGTASSSTLPTTLAGRPSTVAPTSSIAFGSSSSILAAAAAASSSSAAAAASASAAAGAAADPANASTGGGGVSGGTIAGAVVGSLAAAVLLGAVLIFLLLQRRKRQRGRPLSGLYEKPADGRGAWARQAGGSSSSGASGALDEKAVGGGGASTEGMASDAAADDDDDVLDISGAHSAEEHTLALPLSAAAAAGGGARRGRLEADLHPHEMPYQLEPVARASPLLGSDTGRLMTGRGESPAGQRQRASPSSAWQEDAHGPTGLALDGDLGGGAPTAVAVAGDQRRRSSELSRATTATTTTGTSGLWDRRPSGSFSVHSSAALLANGEHPSGTSPAHAARRPSEMSTTSSSSAGGVPGRSGSFSAQARKPVPALVNADASALEQEQYYNQSPPARRRSLGSAEVLAADDGAGAGGRPPTAWDGAAAGRALRLLEVDQPQGQ